MLLCEQVTTSEGQEGVLFNYLPSQIEKIQTQHMCSSPPPPTPILHLFNLICVIKSFFFCRDFASRLASSELSVLPIDCHVEKITLIAGINPHMLSTRRGLGILQLSVCVLECVSVCVCVCLFVCGTVCMCECLC